MNFHQFETRDLDDVIEIFRSDILTYLRPEEGCLSTDRIADYFVVEADVAGAGSRHFAHHWQPHSVPSARRAFLPLEVQGFSVDWIRRNYDWARLSALTTH